MCKAIEAMREESKNEGYLEGYQKGYREGVLEVLSGLVKDGLLSVSDAAKEANLAPNEFLKMTASLTMNEYYES